MCLLRVAYFETERGRKLEGGWRWINRWNRANLDAIDIYRLLVSFKEFSENFRTIIISAFI